MQVDIQISDAAREKIAKLESAPQRMLRPLARAWHTGALEILGRAVRGRFTGKGPFPVSQNKLGVRTGLLRRSLRTTEPEVNLSTGTVSVSMGSNVEYFAPHEFGYKGQVHVKAHTRRTVAKRTNSRGRITKANINSRKNATLVRGRSNYSHVKAHGRKVNIPARRMLGTELESIQTRLLLIKKQREAMASILKLS